MAEQGFEDKALMTRVRSGPLPLPLGVASDSEATGVAEVGPGCRRSRWETPPPSHEFPKAVKLENRPQQFVDKWAAECSLPWFRAFQPKEALNCIIAASLLGPTSSASAQFWRWRRFRQSTNKSLAISTRMRRRSSAPRLHTSSGIVSCALLATCTSEGRTRQRISLCRGLRAS